MKRSPRIIRWISISVILQVALLSYINFIYLPNRSNVTATAFSFAEDTIADKKVSLPANAEKVKVSFNGLFAAYLSDGKLEILDVKAKKTNKVLEPSGGEMSYFRWLPDRDILIYSVKEPGGKNRSVQLLTYDVDASMERSYPKLTGLPADSEVVDIELSALTNVVYFMVKTGDTQAKIYRYNIMDRLKFVTGTGANTVIKETNYEDNLVYGDGKGKVYIRSGKTNRSSRLEFKQKMVLLGVGEEDTIFAGAVDENGKISGIFSGKVDTPVSEWYNVKLKGAVAPEDIFIPSGGRIYIADRSAKKIVEAGGSAELEFEGDLLDILDDYTVTLDGSKLRLTALGTIKQ